jgi:hypothetical protein
MFYIHLSHHIRLSKDNIYTHNMSIQIQTHALCIHLNIHLRIYIRMYIYICIYIIYTWAIISG